MQRLPTLRALQVFEAFGRLGSATAAAAELGVTVGAISQQLRKAEAEVGLRLLNRMGKSLSLTPDGLHYHAEMGAAFALLRAAQARVDSARSTATLTISCLPSLASKWLGAQLFDWQQANPQAAVHLIGENAEPELGDGVDFRLSYGDMITRFDHRTDLFTDWVVPACAPHLRDRLGLGAPADILNAPLLGIEWARAQGASPSWADWAALINAPLPQPKAIVSFSLSAAAIDAAVNGRGFVLAQRSMAGADIAAGRLVVPFDIPLALSQPYALAWAPAALDKPMGAALRGWIKSIARQQGRPPGR